MRAPPHIGPLKKATIPSRIIFVDTETTPIHKDAKTTENVFKMGCARLTRYYRGKWNHGDVKVFWDLNEMWSWIESQLPEKTKTWIVAHNWHFDFFVMNTLAYLKFYGFNVDFFCFETNRFIYTASRGNTKIAFIDSFNFAPTSLREMGKILGKEKMRVEFETVSDADLEIYCARDVEVLSEFICQFFTMMRNWGFGIGYTLASTAMLAFRKTFLQTKIYPTLDLEIRKKEIEAYYGGRCECFKIGKFKGEFYDVDVNSLYPHMMSRKMPVRMAYYLYNPSVNELATLLEKGNVVLADVTVNLKEACLPYRGAKKIKKKAEKKVGLKGRKLPVKAEIVQRAKETFLENQARLGLPTITPEENELKESGLFEAARIELMRSEETKANAQIEEYTHNLKNELEQEHKIIPNKLLFPIGHFRGSYWSPELKLVLESIEKVHLCVVYYSQNLFKEYVDYFFHLKKTAANSKFVYFVAKILLNSLYGKFAQRKEKMKMTGKTDANDGSYQILQNGRLFKIYVLGGEVWEVEGSDFAEKAAIFIPGYISSCGRAEMWRLMKKAGEVFYIDTDGMIVSKKAYLNLKEEFGVDIGQLKLEEISTKIDLKGPKYYKTSGKQKIKGVHQGWRVDFEKTVFEQDRWLKAKSLLKRGIIDRVVIEKFEKRLKGKYDKGIVDEEGNVKPIEL